MNIFRTHSLVWEKLWLEHEIGIPASFGSGRVIEGRDPAADRYLLEAVKALAATDVRFDYVEWDGREVIRSESREGQ